MHPRTIARRATTALALTALLLGPEACKKRHRSVSGGEIATPWTPPATDQIKGVAKAEVVSAIQARLAGPPVKPLGAEPWKHAKNLYGAYPDTPLWLDDKGLDEKRVKPLVRAIAASDSDGFRLDAYPLDSLARALDAVRAGKPTAAQLANADVLLSAVFSAFGEDLLTGQAKPKGLSQDWHINPNDDQVDSALVRALDDAELDQSFTAMRPGDEEYAALRQQYVRLRDAAAKGEWPTVPAGKKLIPGDLDAPARLAALRARLQAEGFQVPAAPAAPSAPPAAAPLSSGSSPAAVRMARAARTGPDVYDRGLAGAVAQFQAHHGIPVDSILGPGTVESMNVPLSYRVGQLAANLERFRWLPRVLGDRYVFVNVPAFKLTAYDSGQASLTMKVIVGQDFEDKNTPVFSDSMEYVVFRPYWNVTPDIQAKELEPKIAADPDYMARNDYEYWSENGVQRIRQKPGDKNSLGYVKFLFPNDYNIYLHDTPQRELFEKDVRAFSHGCIRIEHPDQMAQWVLGWDEAKVKDFMMNGSDNRTIKVPKKIPVYIVYFTTYTQDGQLFFGNDLYHRDDAMVKAVAQGAMQEPGAVQALGALERAAGE